MKKSDFMRGFEEVMGTRFTKEDFLISLLVLAVGLLVLQLGEIVDTFISSFH